MLNILLLLGRGVTHGSVHNVGPKERAWLSPARFLQLSKEKELSQGSDVKEEGKPLRNCPTNFVRSQPQIPPDTAERESSTYLSYNFCHCAAHFKVLGN